MADRLMKELEEISNTDYAGGVDKTPASVMTLGACVSAWSREKTNWNRAIERANHYLQQIIQQYKNGEVGPYDRHVDTWAFESVARLWSSSRNTEAGEQIEALIEQMEDLHEVVPGLFQHSHNMFILALDAWASSGHKDAGRRAMALIRKMTKLHRLGKLEEPNIRALSSAFSAVVKSSGRRSTKTAESLYQQMLQRAQSGDHSAIVNERTLSSLLLT